MYFLDVDTLERGFRGDPFVTRRLERTPRERVRLSSITAEFDHG